MKKVIFSFIALFLITFFSNTIAQIPRIINYQGMLMGNSSQPVSNGNYDLTFKLYDESNTVIWTEVHNKVTVNNGLFQVILGTITPFSMSFDKPYTLGIQVGSDPELQPRTQLTSVAYSIRAEDADKLMGIYASTTPEPNKLLPLDASGKFPNSVLSISGGIDGSGTANYLPMFTGATTLSNSIIFQTGGKLGIGTTTPTEILELAGSDAKIYGLTVGRGSGSVGSNTAFGYQSLYSNTTGTDNVAAGLLSLNANKTGIENTAVGSGSLNSNIAGDGNTAIGLGTLYNNTSGSYSTAIGYRAMFYMNNRNTAFGAYALEGSNNTYNNIALNNTAIGDGSLRYNTSGYYNTATGVSTLITNTAGDGNTATGSFSLFHNATGNYNSAFGQNSLFFCTGNLNSTFGFEAGSNLVTGSNNTIIGANSRASTTDISNEITLGDDKITSLRCNVSSISSLSDARDKKNIRDLTLGLDFLMSIKPRLFNWDRREWYKDRKPDGAKMQETPTAGFIAQELDEAQTKANAEWLNLVLKSNPDRYEATAGNLLPVMVKAIQELKAENESLRNELEVLQGSIAERIEKEVKKILLKVNETNKTKSQFTLNNTEE